MVDPDLSQKYSGYTQTDYVSSKAGVEDDPEWNNNEVNKKIRAAEAYINNKIKPTLYYPYDTDATNKVPADLAEAAAFFASSFINGELKEKEPMRDNMFTKHWTIATNILDGFLEGTTGFIAQLGDSVLSDYLTEPANPEAEPFISGPL